MPERFVLEHTTRSCDDYGCSTRSHNDYFVKDIVTEKTLIATPSGETLRLLNFVAECMAESAPRCHCICGPLA